ncbi:hypothetical protein Zmor_025201 [Zophobas morio]|uniref:Gustatory receptor n=1 Tax=Zophobas morio TaxID=2755281 RepID=A0AA38HRG8_9CUCU|nr:hypothetical protein Zmor_025201 [Zophobas morio]
MSPKSVKVLFHIGKLLGLTPSFSQNEVPLLQKLYTFMLVTLITIFVVLSLSHRTKYQLHSHIKLTVNILIDCHLLIFNWCTALSTVLWKSAKWQQLIENLLVIVHKSQAKIVRNTIAGIIAIIFILITLICVFVFWVKTNGEYYLGEYNVQYFQYFQAFSYNVYLSLIISFLLLEYRNVGKKFNKLICLKNNKELFQGLDNIENSFCFLNDNVNLFNSIFGWPLTLNISFTTLYLLNNFDFMFANSSIFQKQAVSRILVDAILVLIVFVGTAAVLIMCDLVLQESEQILTSAQKLQRSIWPLIPDDQIKMERFRRTISENMPKFSASRFFWVDRSTILKILGTVVTFFIVMIQFRSCQ